MATRTPLRRPFSYFDERDASILHAIGIVALLTVVLLAGTTAIGYVMTANVDGSVTVDNPAYPGDGFCESPPEGDWGCDEPPTVERGVDGIIWDGVGEVTGQSLLLPALGWLVVGTLIHVGSWFAGGEGGAGRSYAVAGWGMAPALVAIPAAVAVLALTFDPVTVTPATAPETVRSELFGSLSGLQTVGPIVSVLTSLWSGVIWFAGLIQARGLTPGRAAVIAGLLVLLGLAGSA